MLKLIALASALGVNADLVVKFAKSEAELQALLKNPESMRERFLEFAKEHKRDYLGNVELTQQKLATFSNNVRLAHNRNVDRKSEVVHGITNLMDWSYEEFRGLLGYGKGPGNAEQLQKKRETVRADMILKGKKSKKFFGSQSRDWRDEGAVTPVKDQGQCGSCWAFSTVESFESAALVQGLVDKSAPFIGAPQELVSCDKGGMDAGCNGGLPENAFKYLKTTPLEPEKDYPYTSGGTEVDGTCKLDKSEGVFVTKKATQLSIWGIGEDQDMTDYILSQGPMSIAVAANDAWQTYTGGIISHADCPDDQPNHAVQAVALSQDGDTPYWVVRNSWAAGWGEEGYIRLTYKENTCSIAFEAFGVSVQKASAENEIII